MRTKRLFNELKTTYENYIDLCEELKDEINKRCKTNLITGITVDLKINDFVILWLDNQNLIIGKATFNLEKLQLCTNEEELLDYLYTETKN